MPDARNPPAESRALRPRFSGGRGAAPATVFPAHCDAPATPFPRPFHALAAPRVRLFPVAPHPQSLVYPPFSTPFRPSAQFWPPTPFAAFSGDGPEVGIDWRLGRADAVEFHRSGRARPVRGAARAAGGGGGRPPLRRRPVGQSGHGDAAGARRAVSPASAGREVRPRIVYDAWSGDGAAAATRVSGRTAARRRAAPTGAWPRKCGSDSDVAPRPAAGLYGPYPTLSIFDKPGQGLQPFSLWRISLFCGGSRSWEKRPGAALPP